MLILFVLVYNLSISQIFDNSECNKHNDSVCITLKISQNKRFVLIEVKNLSSQVYYFSKEEFQFTFFGEGEGKRIEISSVGSPNDKLILLGTIKPKSKVKHKIKVPKDIFHELYLNYSYLPESKLKNMGYKLEGWDKKISDVIFQSIECDIKIKAKKFKANTISK